MALIFAVNELNKDPNLLPNVTLGYHIFGTCENPKKTLGYALQILSGEKMEAPNYSCGKHGKVAGFIGDSSLHTTQALALLLGVYMYTQINHKVADIFLSNRKLYPTLYRMTQDDKLRYDAIVNFFLYFGWNWVVMVTHGDGSGDAELQELKKTDWEYRASWDTYVTFGLRYQTTLSPAIQQMDDLIYKTSSPVSRKISGHVDLDEYRSILALIFAVNEINRDPNLLRNVTLGYHIFNTCDDAKYTLGYAMQIMSGNKREVPNYSCRKHGEVAAFIGDTSFRTTQTLAQLLNLYRYTQIPESRCNDRCPPGYRKAPGKSLHVCCYICVPCSKGEVSNETGSNDCIKCPDDEWPDEKNVKCLSKTYECLSYENDVMVLFISLATSMFAAITLLIIKHHIYNWDTPVVKASNRTVSFILLISILMSFLCVFLFLGHPTDITCKFRQTVFGIFFSIAVSSVLAKTFTVNVAFKATKPGSFWKKWVTMKVSKFLVLTCSSLQVLICVIWLSVSPPYQEYDMHSYPGTIIIQCNEGSVIGFYSMLGYIGFLATVSFVLAFMVRTLPDSFNEAKYITFSMLVFCAVWIAMIPAYLSTRGKYMVAVEIFAILASSFGILGCIFFPKCYIIIFKPELNTRKITGCKNHKSINE
ncbi:vomeronasal type-2 receptor 26-like [Pyxicephalus adspersus]|uniref:vomeronasal type-2 receptor 26-like n=1 Tax=Pyxicephalus adspersus TaxID=30357 RepID=UPI003B5A5B5F